MNDLVSVKLCVLSVVLTLAVSLVVHFHWDLHFHVCPVFFSGALKLYFGR